MKEQSKGTYVSVKVENHEQLSKWFQDQGVKTIPSEELHCTIAYSRKEFKHIPNKVPLTVYPNNMISIEPLGDEGCVVLKFYSDELQNRWRVCMDEGATWDYAEYIPHCTISLNLEPSKINTLKLPDFDIIFGPEIVEELDLDWKSKIEETMPSNIIKSFAEKSGKSETEVEKLWDETKKQAEENGHKEDYEYIVGILKKKLNLNEESEMTYKEFYMKKLEKFGVKSPKELSDEDNKKFHDEIEAEWTGEKDEEWEEPEDKKDEETKCDESFSLKAIKALSINDTVGFVDIVREAMLSKLAKNEKFKEISNRSK